jgi:hypothetical protein
MESFEDAGTRLLGDRDNQPRNFQLYPNDPNAMPISEASAKKNAAGRRYTTGELDAMEQIAIAQGMHPKAAAEASQALENELGAGERFAGGAAASLQRTILGLKQAYQYMVGDDAGRAAINEAIKRLEADPVLTTPEGRLGEAAGTAAQFMGPQGVGSAAAKLAPKVIVKGIQTVTGVPGSVGRSAIQGGAFEAAQPVSPSDASTEEYLMGKAGKTALGTAGGAVVGKVGGMVTSPGIPISPERTAVVKEAERLGIKLTPAQRTGDVTLSQFEEGLASRPGSAKIILDAREAQQKVLNKKAAEALGSKGDAPNEAVLSQQRTLASKGYEPIAAIPSMSWDTQYILSLEKFANKQAVKATGSADAASAARRLMKGSGKLTGNGFLEELQGIRDMSYGARQNGDVATAGQLGDLGEIMEDYAERRVAKLAKLGQVPADAMDQLRAARTEYAKIHAIEKATEPVSGRVSSLKYLTGEFKRSPASKGPSQSPVATGLADVGATARVLKQVTPYIGSSGTAERIAGQQLVEATQGPFAAIRASGPIAKNYLAAKFYMKHGGQPGPLGNRLTPTQNMYIKRLLPDMAFATKEGLTE